ncbi:unnamed protein product [Caenorhabditis auriculariae]|uniref:Uncharacterized protein n=1 Tax=Caenorhabditis auriculariae TaxID=2777116 RepID=A0A8S1HAU6_9PELO|nr:unnamed protein product [Caenorhabditis auriculariae]
MTSPSHKQLHCNISRNPTTDFPPEFSAVLTMLGKLLLLTLISTAFSATLRVRRDWDDIYPPRIRPVAYVGDRPVYSRFVERAGPNSHIIFDDNGVPYVVENRGPVVRNFLLASKMNRIANG